MTGSNPSQLVDLDDPMRAGDDDAVIADFKMPLPLLGSSLPAGSLLDAPIIGFHLGILDRISRQRI
jgi:hypothetical protein